METRQGVSITWSSYNYPTYFNTDANGESVGFSYGADRRAWYEQTNGSAGLEKMYDVDGLFDDVNSAGTDDFRHYVYANGFPVAIVSRKSGGTNTIYYLLTDHQGSIAAITDSTGAVVVGESFAAYGARRNPSSWSGAPSSTDLTTIAGITRHGYTFQGALGQQTGLIYMVGRVQDAITGRFLSADPTIPQPMSPQSYNRYSYTENNPLTYIDPTGFAGCVAVPEGQLAYVGDPLAYSMVPTPALCTVDAPPEPPDPPLAPINPPAPPPPPVVPDLPDVPDGPGPGQSQPGSTPENANPPVQKQQTMEQCLSGGGGPGEGTGQQGLGYIDMGNTAFEGGTESLVGASATSVGKAFAGPSPFGPLAPPTNAGYEALGSQIQSSLEPFATGLRYSGYVLGFGSIVLDAYTGLETGGPTGAAAGTTFGLTDFGVDLALTTLGPVGAVAAIGFTATGGAKSATAAVGTAVMCSAKLGVPPPMVFRQRR